MKPVKFEECNVVFAEDQPEYQSLPAHCATRELGDVVSCWELSEEEVQKIVETRRIYISQLSFHQPLQPIYPTVNKDDIFENGKLKEILF